MHRETHDHAHHFSKTVAAVMEMTAEHAFLPDIFFFLTFEKKQMINQDSVVMQVKVVEDEPTTSYVEGSDASWKSLFLYKMQKM